MGHIIKGIPTSGGLAIGKIHHLDEVPRLYVHKTGKGKEYEQSRLNYALKIAKNELNDLITLSTDKVGQEDAEIFSAQALMLNDPMLVEATRKKIFDESFNAEYAFRTSINEMIDLFDSSDNLYIKERIIDLKDISKRVLNILSGQKNLTTSFNEDVILVADELMPSYTINLNTLHVKGIITKNGSITSHSAILSRNLGIPSVVGIDKLLLSEGQLILLNGKTGEVILDPSTEEVKTFNKKVQKLNRKKETYEQIKNQEAVTLDGKKYNIYANIGTIKDLENAKSHGAEGIGLLRTENQFLESKTLPSENDLYMLYQNVTNTFKDSSVTVRTLDIGGDKTVGYLPKENEENPFLGNRGIRYLFDNPTLFSMQLRALLKASNGNLSIMFPMVTTIDEIINAKKILNEVKEDLEKEFIEVIMPKIGIMIEVPAAAYHMESISKHVDFVSIGTNDLIQYLFAADRVNEKVSHLYLPLHPVVIKTIKMIVDTAHKNNIIVSVCGEMAGNPKQALLLLGLGVDTLSMSSSLIPEIKYIVNKSRFKTLKTLSNKAIKLDSEFEVEQLVNKYLEKL